MKIAAADSSFGYRLGPRLEFLVIAVRLESGKRVKLKVRREEGKASSVGEVEEKAREMEEALLEESDADLKLLDGYPSGEDIVGVVKNVRPEEANFWAGPFAYRLEGPKDRVVLAKTLFSPPYYYPFLLAKADVISNALFRGEWEWRTRAKPPERLYRLK